jgi:cell division inhibitor SulA/protein ImuA
MLRETTGDPAVALAALLADSRVWKLKDAAVSPPSRPVWSTGHRALDARLPGGGWPTASLVEVLLETTGLGEVQLFLPALVECQHPIGGDVPWLVWIAPPHEPYAPALAQQGVDLSRLLVVRPASATEALWAAEQALSSGVCAAVLLWLQGTDHRWLRRLKLAAESGGALGVLFRPERHRFESSPASLRLLMTQGAHETNLELVKVQGGTPGPVEYRATRMPATGAPTAETTDAPRPPLYLLGMKTEVSREEF